MKRFNRKTDPKVIGGLVQKKNNWALTPDYYNTRQRVPVIDRKRPGQGYRHLLRRRDVLDFIGILPDWDELSAGLDAIVLAPGSYYVYGYHTDGVVHVCAWEEGLWLALPRAGYEREREILERLGVPCEKRDEDVLCKFTEETARAHQLLATLLHELGHHHDRMTTRNKAEPSRGEPYAEDYARRYAQRIWVSYQEVFGVL
jgi:hypothetical protein